jgi:hypothetical protein
MKELKKSSSSHHNKNHHSRSHHCSDKNNNKDSMMWTIQAVIVQLEVKIDLHKVGRKTIS